MPMARQVEEHRIGGHIPLRESCKFCVMGQGLETQHRASGGAGIEIQHCEVSLHALVETSLKMIRLKVVPLEQISAE